jgi:tRNA pseudouridine65 synthase
MTREELVGTAPPRILHRDDLLLAVDKPSGMLVHRGWGRDRVTLVDLVKELLGRDAVHPLHRIDRGTSGVVLFALDPATAAAMREPFETGAVTKRYLALVRGVAPEEGIVDHPIPRREGGPRVDAATAFRRLAVAELEPRSLSLVEAIPGTGRLHQVRRHMKHAGHPVIGDANYGVGALNRELAERYGLGRLALHAGSLALNHPVTGARLEIVSPVPEDLAVPLARIFGAGLRLS